MKFALRDDDLNFFFNVSEIERWYKNIWNICPVSMSAIPFVKGNWKINTDLLEKLGPNNIDENFYLKIKSDTKTYSLGDNNELVSYIKKKISENKIYITIHGIEHRNGDTKLPIISNNFAIGAEFYTNRDLTNQLLKSKKYLERIFHQDISVFTPPQNLLSFIGIKAIVNSGLAICGDLPSMRNLKTIKLIGIKNFLKYISFRVKYKTNIFPFPIINEDFKYITHFRLQPGTNIKILYKKFEEVHSFNGNFVLSTHSYAFDYRMKDTNQTMQFELEKFINYCKNKESVSFVSLNKMFS